MTRTRFPCWLCMLLVLLLLPACTATQRTVATMTLCLGSFAAEIALFATHTGSFHGSGLLTLVGCEVGHAVTGVTWIEPGPPSTPLP